MNAKSVNANKPLTPQQQAMRRAFAASKRIPNAPAKDRAKRVHAWAEFVKQAIRDEDAAAGKELKK